MSAIDRALHALHAADKLTIRKTMICTLLVARPENYHDTQAKGLPWPSDFNAWTLVEARRYRRAS